MSHWDIFRLLGDFELYSTRLIIKTLHIYSHSRFANIWLLKSLIIFTNRNKAYWNFIQSSIIGWEIRKKKIKFEFTRRLSVWNTDNKLQQFFMMPTIMLTTRNYENHWIQMIQRNVCIRFKMINTAIAHFVLSF